MHRKNLNRTFLGIAALATTVAGAQGCVADRPSRNAVFDENQYLRKDFIVRPGTGTNSADPGWVMKATIVQTSTPNPLATDAFNLFTGAESGGALVRFDVSSDKLSLVDMRELSNDPAAIAQNTRTSAIVNAWPITNVDLKYRINLDGEKTNLYEENQELDWQVRQWVKINFDKNDFSDIAGLGPQQTLMLAQCADPNGSATLVPNSFLVDETNNYIQWTTAVTVALNYGNADCVTAFGAVGNQALQMGRSTVTLNVMYSMSRLAPVDPTSYTPIVLAEKDPIRHKYGAIELTNFARDTDTSLIAARQLVMRYNPSKPIVYYFAQGFPEDKKTPWTKTGGFIDQTNAILQKAGAAARLTILNFNDEKAYKDAKGTPRNYGDVRYSFIRWASDFDTGAPFIAVTQFVPDYRTGETISTSINVANYPVQDLLAQHFEAYFTSVLGVDPFATDPPVDPTDPTKQLSASCAAGDTVSLLAINPNTGLSAYQANVYANSTLYQRMAQYLPAAPDGAGAPGPSDYVYQHVGSDAAEFYKAYYQLLPYITYADPEQNQFVTPSDLSTAPGMSDFVASIHGETLFQQEMAATDHGSGAVGSLEITGGASGMAQAYAAVDSVRQLWNQHRNYQHLKQLNHGSMRGDTPDLISFPYTMNRATRTCIATDITGATVAPHWESKAEWLSGLQASFWDGVQLHEFGHALGLEHNFMGSVDKANWPIYTDSKNNQFYGKASSSIMEYTSRQDDVFWNDGGTGTATTGWLSYDQAALAWIYSNNLSATSVGPKPIPSGAPGAGISGQVSNTVPWNDPIGFGGAAETNFLYCNEQHLTYTPLCRQFDEGVTPSEITSNDIEAYEFNYQWRNFRNYYKVWDDSPYATKVSATFDGMRRFMALDVFDFSTNELTDKLIRIGVVPPAGAVNSGNFYQEITNHFLSDVGNAEQLIAAFHEAVIQQGSGQRPYVSTYDPYYGDVVQQGISIDKELSFINWLGLWPFDNYDPSQAEGLYGSSLTIGPGQTQPAQSWSTASSMLGEKGPWDAYPGFFPGAVALFAHDTQTPTFTGSGYPQMRDWIGGHSFTRLADVLTYFQNIAVQNPTAQNGCASLATCTYNPLTPQQNVDDIGHSNPVTQTFIGPDQRRWVWVYLSDRNQWLFTDQDRNPSSYLQVYTYNTDVNTNYDDGNIGPVYYYQSRIKYMIDAYGLYNNDTGSAQ